MVLTSLSAAVILPVDMDELNQLMRMLNMPVVSGQMEKMMAEVSSTGDGEITMEDFLHIMKAKEKNPHTKHLLLADFELFRPANCPKGYIPREQLVNVLLKQSRKCEVIIDDPDLKIEISEKNSTVIYPLHQEGRGIIFFLHILV